MAYTAVSRSMRDGAIVIKDGADAPNVCSIACDDGDLNWTERFEKVTTRCRGAIGSRRPGDEQECQLQFSIHWMNLINASAGEGSAAYMPYEFIKFLPEEMESTSEGLNTLNYEFTVLDPEGTASELIVFEDVFCTQLTCQEGDPNTISFQGESSQTAPTITQITP